MIRYFLEVSYKGTRYSGFQSQHNALTIQQEVEKAAETLLGTVVKMTGSSRTDAGVHALQNYFHFDLLFPVNTARGITGFDQFVYKMNAILPADVTVINLYRVRSDAHCRFDALQREYKYYIYNQKNPFLSDRAYYYPYTIDLDLMNQAASLIKEYQDFTSFSKRNTQVKTFLCDLKKSFWEKKDGCLIYNVEANRFLRGMVRALTSTMLRVGRHQISIAEFRQIVDSNDCTKASFAVPPHGLFLTAVKYSVDLFYSGD